MSAALLALVALLTGGPPQAPPSTPTSTPTPPTTVVRSVLTGTYANERGSVLALQVGTDGIVTGSFRSGVGNVSTATRFAVRGAANGDVLGFVVDFGRAGSVGSWTGQLRGNELICLWLLSKDIVDDAEATELWGAVRTGSDVFVRCTDCTP